MSFPILDFASHNAPYSVQIANGQDGDYLGWIEGIPHNTSSTYIVQPNLFVTFVLQRLARIGGSSFYLDAAFTLASIFDPRNSSHSIARTRLELRGILNNARENSIGLPASLEPLYTTIFVSAEQSVRNNKAIRLAN